MPRKSDPFLCKGWPELVKWVPVRGERGFPPSERGYTRPLDKGCPSLEKGGPSHGNGVPVPRQRGTPVPRKWCTRTSEKGCPLRGKGLPAPREGGFAVPRKTGCPALGQMALRPPDNGNAALGNWCPVPRERAPVLQNTGSRPSVMAYPSLGNGGAVPRKGGAHPSEKGVPVQGERELVTRKRVPAPLKRRTRPSENGYIYPSRRKRVPFHRNAGARNPEKTYRPIGRGVPVPQKRVPVPRN